MTKKEQIIELSEQGLNYSEIARTVGVTRQYVTQVFYKEGIKLTDFRRMSEEQCIYPNFCKWWNENRMTYKKFFELMDFIYHEVNIAKLQQYLSGKSNPRKHYIDRMITATGLSYETLFYREGD